MRAAIYVRVSTDDQARHGFSLQEQREACRRRASDLGAKTFLEFADEGISGATLDRPGLEGLREAAKDGRVDLVVIRDPDRLARKLAHQLLLTEEFEKAGVRLEFLDFEWRDTPEGKLFYSVRGAIAEYEKEKIRQRTVRGKRQKAKQGGIPIRFYVYGYTYDPETGRVSINEEEAAVVRIIFVWFVSEDIGVNGVAKRLNDSCVPSRKGKKWHKQVVRQILANPVYKGTWYYKDIAIPVPAIVDKETWEKAQEKLRKARRLWAGKGKQEYLLSGIISCSDCGQTMTGVYTKWWGKKERRYTCDKHYQGARREGCRPRKMVPARYIEEAVWEQVKGWLKDPEALAAEAGAADVNAGELRKELERIEKRLAEVEKGREAVLDAIASGLFELDVKTKNKLVDLKRRKERLELRKKEIALALSGADGAAARVEELKALAKEVLEKIDELEFSEKKALVRSLVSQVVVSGRGKRGANGLTDIEITVVVKVPEAARGLKTVQEVSGRERQA